jgi:phage terminase large subunit-like protein
LLSGLPIGDWDAFLDELSPNALLSLPWLFEHWALEGHQLPPAGDWTTWVILGGRGAGKTRAGSEWIRAQVEGSRPGDAGRCSRVALVAETIDQAREVMVFGESGIMASSPPDRRPEWQASRKRLVWPNGAVAQLFSASDPESLRGPQFDCAWADELAKWPKGEEAWDMLQFALRLGEHPRQVVTTTPRGVPLLQALLADPRTVSTHAPTSANRMHLAKSFLAHVTERLRRHAARAAGTRRRTPVRRRGCALDAGEPRSGAGAAAGGVRPDRGGGGPAGLERVGCGRMRDPRRRRCDPGAAAGLGGGGPRGWHRLRARARRLGPSAPFPSREARADRLVAEVNQGGDLSRSWCAGSIPWSRSGRCGRPGARRLAPSRWRRSTSRAGEPCRDFRRLEDQMQAMTVRGFVGRGSPDRVDALVWALTDLMIEPARTFRPPPRVRRL